MWRKSSQGGFTLLEMIVVLVIIGLLMGLVGPRLFHQADRAKLQTAQTQVKMLRGALETMKLDIGRYPTDQEGLELLRQKPQDPSIAPLWHGPYLDGSVPVDPWGHPYVYSAQASKDQAFSLYSLGPPGKNDPIGYLPLNGVTVGAVSGSPASP
jgi:general secretion pathway protein G